VARWHDGRRVLPPSSSLGRMALLGWPLGRIHRQLHGTPGARFEYCRNARTGRTSSRRPRAQPTHVELKRDMGDSWRHGKRLVRGATPSSIWRVPPIARRATCGGTAVTSQHECFLTIERP
jgi:hypothetical protein